MLEGEFVTQGTKEIDRAAARVIVGAAALFFVVMIIWMTSGDPYYFRKAHSGVPVRGYPFLNASASCAVLVAEAVVFLRLLGRMPGSPFRALVTLAVCVAGAGAMFPLVRSLHVPNDLMLHLLWLLSAGAISLATFLIAIAARLFPRCVRPRRRSR